MKTTESNPIPEERKISKFTCYAPLGMGYVFWMRIDYKNKVSADSKGESKWEENWSRSPRGETVSVGYSGNSVITDIKEIKNGALVRLNLEVMAGAGEVFDSEVVYLYDDSSELKAHYEAKGVCLRPYVTREGTSKYFDRPHNTVAYTYQIENFQLGDHTYVRAGDVTYKCAGKSVGGGIICLNNGNPELSKQIAMSDGNAGLIYALTGVCHQIANRILYPANILVDSVRSYGFSWFLFGTYDTGPFNPPKADEAYCLATDTLFAKINTLYADFRVGKISEEQLFEREAEVIADHLLPDSRKQQHHKLSSDVIDCRRQIMTIQDSFKAKIQMGRTHADKVNDIGFKLQESLAKEFSPDDFQKLVGCHPDKKKLVVDVARFE